MSARLQIKIGAGYAVDIGAGLLSGVGEAAKTLGNYSAAAVLTDKNVDKLYAEPVEASLRAAGLRTARFTVEPGEGSKSLKTLGAVYDFMTGFGLTRTDLLVCVGGGVVGDLSGFAAATYLRGVDYLAVPTTLLAMLDSSVGGKTGVNLPAGKNLAGAFYQPRAVIADVLTLETLDDENFKCGIGEALKYAMIRDPSMLALLDGRRGAETLTELVLKGLAVKKFCVEKDPFDRGIRQYLNFGHTLGHVVEKKSGYAVPHGVAVGIGMAKLTRYAEQKGWTEPGTAAEIERVLNVYGMPSDDPATAEELLRAAKNDKKRKGDKLTLVLLKRPGACYLRDVEAET